MGLKAEPADPEADPVLSWSANSITINHRRAIIAGNDSSRYGFILYGIKSKDKKNLGRLLLDGVRACLEAECIAPELIHRYMDDCGANVTFTKTPGSSVVARLNKLCLSASYIAELLTTEQLFQQQILLRFNNDYITSKSEPPGDYKNGPASESPGDRKRIYHNVYTKFADDISQRYGAHPYGCNAVELEVELELESLCRRRIIVPSGYTFRQLHLVLQNLFCWQRCHLHEFSIERYPNGRLKHTLVGHPQEFDLEGETTQPDSSVQLSEIFPHYDHIIYTYDYGDDWTHHIRFVGIINNYDKNHAVCLSGEGDAPPEDVGGAPGYARLLQVLADPEDPDYDNLKAWYEWMHCRPFDLDRVNSALQHCVRSYDY